MSQRDRDLIKFAGLSVEAAASLLGRTRQAVYQGMSAPNRDYFGSLEVVGLFQDAKRRKIRHLQALRHLIETEYGRRIAELIDADFIDNALAMSMIEESEEIILGINGSNDVIHPKSSFTPTIDAALQVRKGTLCLIAAAGWIRDYFLSRMAQLHPGVAPEDLPIHILTDDMMENFPSFCLLSRQGERDGFWFGTSSLDRISVENATRLWNYLSTTIVGPAQHRAGGPAAPARAGRSRTRRTV
jgi:hypothetical protein